MSKLDPEIKAKLKNYKNVVGTGYGFKIKDGQVTDVPAIIVFVSRKVPISGLSPDGVIPKSIDGVPTDVREIKARTLAEDPSRYRPSPGGCSVGHYQITAGTLGAWVRYKDKLAILSNNHVLANSNAASLGDRILQPGPYDGGQLPIAYLTEFKEIFLDGGNPANCEISELIELLLNLLSGFFGSGVKAKFIRISAEPNYVDAAVAESAEPTKDFVDTRILDIGELNSPPVSPSLGQEVYKRGRTTRKTVGFITALDVEVQVSGYGGNGVATFLDQVIIETKNNSEFSAGGDSGSLIVNANNQPVGLLFAGGEDESGRLITVANNIDRVLEAFPGIEFL